MTIKQRRAKALKIEREIEARIAKLPRVPRVRLVKERLAIRNLRTEATRLAA